MINLLHSTYAIIIIGVYTVGYYHMQFSMLH